MGRKRLRNRSNAVTAQKQQQQQQQQQQAAEGRIQCEKLRSAVNALLKDAVAFETRRNQSLIQAGEPVQQLLQPQADFHLVVTFAFPPFKQKLRPVPIALKHSLWKEGQTEVCLFVKDPQRLVKDYLAQHGNGGVTRVLGVEKLRKRYGTHEGKRELSTLYDVFLVDKRVAPMMPNLLGNAFLHSKLMPLAVDMTKDVVASIQRTLNSTPFTPRQGTCTNVKVGTTEFTEQQVVDNVLMAIDGIVRRCERGWKDIQSFSLKTSRSPAVPIYLSLPWEEDATEKDVATKDDTANEASVAKKPKVLSGQ